jgi:hypothetical protein
MAKKTETKTEPVANEQPAPRDPLTEWPKFPNIDFMDKCNAVLGTPEAVAAALKRAAKEEK